MPINKYSNVYVPHQYQTPFDLGMYGQVMQQKQMRFETTFSAMQSSLDAIAENTDIARLPEREYFQNVLQKTTDAINKYGSQDLGNTQIQSKVMGLARSIGQDNIINTARINTAAMRKQDAAAEEAKKKGKWADANQHVYDKAKNAYLDPNDKSLGKSFDGQWEDYYDMGKPLMEIGKVMKSKKTLSYPDSFPGYAPKVLPTAPNASGQQKDASAKEVVEASTAIQQRIVTTESLTEDDVKEVFRNVINSDPRAARQLQINSEYYADNITNDDLKKQYKTQMGSEYTQYKTNASEMERLENTWTQNGDPKMAAYYKDYKEKYQAKAKELEGKLDEKNDAALTEEVKNRRYAIAGDIYGSDFARGYAKAFTVDRESVQVITNMENFAKLQGEIKLRQIVAKGGKVAESAVTGHMPEVIKNEDAMTTITKTADIILKNRETIKSGMDGVSAQFKADYQGTEFPIKAIEKPFEFYNDLLDKTKKGGKLTLEEERFMKDGQKWAIQEYENATMMANVNNAFKETGLEGTSNARDKLATNIKPVSLKRQDGTDIALSSEDQRALADISMNPERSVQYKSKTIVDSRGDPFTFNYMTVVGDTDFARRLNAQQEERVNKFVAEAGNKNLADWKYIPFTGDLIDSQLDKYGIIRDLPFKTPQGSGTDKFGTSWENWQYLNKRFTGSTGFSPSNPGIDKYMMGSLGLESVEKNVSNQVLEGYNISRGPGTSVFSEKKEFQDELKPLAENYQRNWATGDSFNETEGIAKDDQILNVIGVSKGKRGALDVGVIYVNVKTGTNKEMSKAIVVDSGAMGSDMIFGNLKTNPYFETEGFLQGGYAAMKKRDPKAVYYSTTQTNSPYTISTNKLKNVRLQYHVAGETYYASYQRPDGSWEKLPVGHANLVHLNQYVAAYIEQAK